MIGRAETEKGDPCGPPFAFHGLGSIALIHLHSPAHLELAPALGHQARRIFFLDVDDEHLGNALERQRADLVLVELAAPVPPIVREETVADLGAIAPSSVDEQIELLTKERPALQRVLNAPDDGGGRFGGRGGLH